MIKRLALVLAFAAIPAAAQGSYTRTSISSAQADVLVTAAVKEAANRKVAISIVVVDESGQIVLSRRLDGSLPHSMEIARRKAVTAALLGMPTKLLQDGFAAQGGELVLAVPDVMPIQGGLPITHNGKTIGAVGISGSPAPVDEAIAQVGIDAITPAKK